MAEICNINFSGLPHPKCRKSQPRCYGVPKIGIPSHSRDVFSFNRLLSFFVLSLENPFKCVFHGKERVRSVGFLTVVNVIVWGLHYYVPIKHAVHLVTRLPFIFSINPAQGY